MIEINNASLQALHRTLQDLPVKVEKNVLRGMIRAASKPIVEEARARAPELKDADPRREAGALKKSIRAMSTQSKGGLVKGGVVAGSSRRTLKTIKDAFYAKWVEYGRRGMAAIPFMRPAADAKSGAAVEAAARYVRERVDAGDLTR